MSISNQFCLYTGSPTIRAISWASTLAAHCCNHPYHQTSNTFTTSNIFHMNCFRADWPIGLVHVGFYTPRPAKPLWKAT